MYPNIRAEQARLNLSDKDVSSSLGISLYSYRRKKSSGHFYPSEITKLIIILGKGFDYLFDEDEISSNKN